MVNPIQDIDFRKDPKSKVEGTNMTFLEYYEKNYAIRIKDDRQPLLVVTHKDDDKPTFSDLFNEENSKQFQELDFGINPVVNDF